MGEIEFYETGSQLNGLKHNTGISVSGNRWAHDVNLVGPSGNLLLATEAKQDTIIERLKIDPHSGFLVTVPFNTYQTHVGDRYKTNDPVTLGDGDTREWLIITPDTTTEIHATFAINGDLAGRAQLFEETTKTGGTTVPSANRNRNSSNTATVTIAHTPGGTGDGIPGPDEFFGGGKFTAGGNIESSTPVILKRNTKYLLRVTSDAATNRINIIMWFNEEVSL